MSNDVVFSQDVSFFSRLIFSLTSSFVLCKMVLSQPSESRIVKYFIISDLTVMSRA